ncbi:MAG: (Fe-S)-binding protein [Thermoplasmata archaeon]
MKTSKLKPLEKEILTCTMCGFCKAVCPVGEEICWDSSTARGLVILSYGLLENEIEIDDSVVESLAQCTLCKQCEVKCPSKVKITEIIEATREDIANAGASLNAHKNLLKNITEHGNPFGESKSMVEQLKHKDKVGKKAKVAYFVGCFAAYKEQNIANATLSILDKLNVDYSIVDGKCCGCPLQAIGYTGKTFKEIAEYNIKKIEETGAEKVLFSCADGYKTFRVDYPKVEKFDLQPMHITEFLSDMKFDLRELPKKVTYHDPCYLGRHLGVYDAPRKLLQRIPKIEFTEMKSTREQAKCCGAGGGVLFAYPELAKKLAKKRVEAASFADIMVTACPLCVDNLKKGREISNSKIEILDIVELIDRLL